MPKQYQYITLNITIPIILRNRKRAPERCVRNLMELGEDIKKHASTTQKEEIYIKLLELCKEEQQQPIIDYFFKIYLAT